MIVTIGQQTRRLLHIHPPRRCDDRAIHEFFGRLGSRTRYLRFLTPTPVPGLVLDLITSVDDCRLALIAEVDGAEGTTVVAVGNLAAISDDTAEVGLVVGDEWQRQGIGKAVAMRVLEAAEARGFSRFVAHVLSENTVMRQLLDQVGVIVSTKTQYCVSEVSFVRRPRD